MSPYIVELSSVLERALNVAHTGNVRVIATSLMNPLFVGRSLVDHGTPTLSDHIIMGQTANDPVHIPDIKFPRNHTTRQPLTASKRSQIFNYGVQHWEVRSSAAPITSLYINVARMFRMWMMHLIGLLCTLPDRVQHHNHEVALSCLPSVLAQRPMR